MHRKQQAGNQQPEATNMMWKSKTGNHISVVLRQISEPTSDIRQHICTVRFWWLMFNILISVNYSSGIGQFFRNFTCK